MSGSEFEPVMGRREKLEAKRYNELVKFIASVINSLALAVFGLGFLRVLFEPGAVWPSSGMIFFTIAVPLALELIALYLIGSVRLES